MHSQGIGSIARFALLLGGAFGISGCSVFSDDWFDEQEVHWGHSSQPEQIAISEPIVGKTFALESEQKIVGRIQVIEARYEDTFVDIARSYGLGFDELVAANPEIDPWLPGQGTRIILPTKYVIPASARSGIVINVAAKRLFYFHSDETGQASRVSTYPVGVGRMDWGTPIGQTSVVTRARDPVWFVPASIRKEHADMGDPLPAQVPPGPDNPLGSFVLGLGLPGYLIHGTNKPDGVGMRVSHGCVRLFPEDIEVLYEFAPVGTPVEIVNQPLLLAWQGSDLYLEVHASLEEDVRDLTQEFSDMLVKLTDDAKYPAARLDEDKTNLILAEQRGFPVSVLRNSQSVQATIDGALLVANVLAQDTELDSVDD